MRYTVVLIPGTKPGRHVAHVPTIPGCITQGDSVAEAIAMAQDAAMVADFAEHGGEVPIEAAGAVVASVYVSFPADVPAVTRGAPSPGADPANCCDTDRRTHPWQSPSRPRVD
jgi:predicted RNase H-like HicB family nuclease